MKTESENGEKREKSLSSRENLAPEVLWNKPTPTLSSAFCVFFKLGIVTSADAIIGHLILAVMAKIMYMYLNSTIFCFTWIEGTQM